MSNPGVRVLPGAVAWWRSTMRRLRLGWRAALTRVARLTGAASVAYVLAGWVLSATRPLTAALTALLIVQVTVLGTVADTARRILSVVLGVVVAVVFAAAFGFSVASLAVLIAAALLLGQLFRLGDHLLEVPISAMLVLGVNGAAHSVATDRIAETLVGAVAGVLVAVLFPPTVQGRTASAAVEEFAVELAELLRTVAVEVALPVTAEQTQRWLEQSRRLSISTDRIDDLLDRARDSRRLNPRAAGRRDTGPGLRAGLATLEHCAVTLRGFYRSIADRVGPQSGEHYLYEPDTRQAFSVLLLELADALTAFGALVRAEADAQDDDLAGHPGPSSEVLLTAALESVQEPRARLAELLAVDPRQDPQEWEENGAMLAAVGRVLRELDAEEHARQRQRQVLAGQARGPATQVVTRMRTAAKHLADLPFRWHD